MSIDEARVFSSACELFAPTIGDTFYRGALNKAQEVINSLCDELEKLRIQKEKTEGEKEMRDLPPTPPIESKEKEEGEKKDSLSLARAREAVMRMNREADEVFDAFWEKYPAGHKTAKKKCRAKMRIIYRDAKDKAKFVNEFLGGLDRWLASKRWSEGIIVNPSTFLSQERWLDNPEPSAQSVRDEAEEAKRKREAEAADACQVTVPG